MQIWLSKGTGFFASSNTEVVGIESAFSYLLPSINIDVASLAPGTYTVTVLAWNQVPFDYSLMAYTSDEYIHFFDNRA